jgi:hypothetical protein
MLEQSTDPGAIPALLNANRNWLIDANERGDEDDDDTDLERTWTRALFECAATRAKIWADAERNTLVFDVLVASAPCPSVARLLLDLLELFDPQKAEPFLLKAAGSWSARGNQRFWNEFGIGQRVCALSEKVAIQPPAEQWMEISDAIAATGVVAGEKFKQALRACQ